MTYFYGNKVQVISEQSAEYGLIGKVVGITMDRPDYRYLVAFPSEPVPLGYREHEIRKVEDED